MPTDVCRSWDCDSGPVRLAGEYLRTFRRSHAGIDTVDYVVAASVRLHGAELATLNVKHFPMIEGLRPPW